MQQGVMGLISKKRDNQVQNTNYANLEHKWQKKKGRKYYFLSVTTNFLACLRKVSTDTFVLFLLSITLLYSLEKVGKNDLSHKAVLLIPTTMLFLFRVL